jgi:putative DNA primase/helicase
MARREYKPEQQLDRPGDTFEAIAEMDIPERQFLLRPVIPTQGITMIYSTAGVGKTMLALSIAQAVGAGEEFAKWTAPAPEKVVYFDGEMALADVGPRVKALRPSMGNVRLYTPDRMDELLPDLALHEGRVFVERRLFDAKLLILDNLSTLFRSNSENEAKDWAVAQHWLLGLRRDGLSVLLLHHAGKSGMQRGTSKRVDVMDTVLALKLPPGYNRKRDGCRFEVHFEKSRGVWGEQASAFELKYKEVDGKAVWERKDGDMDPRRHEVMKLRATGKSLRQIALEMALSKSTVHRWLEEAGESDAW